MGSDIFYTFESLKDGISFVEHDIDVFDYRSYRVWGFLGNVRNRYKSPFISSRRGVLENSTAYCDEDQLEAETGRYDHSFVYLSELVFFDYEKVYCFDGLEDQPMREFLPECFFDDLEKLKEYADKNKLNYFDCRLVFSFYC